MALTMQFCFLVLLSLVLQPIYCANVTFTVDPVSINTTLNSTVIFTCEATATVSLTFRVNGESDSHGEVMHKGFTQSINGSYDLRTGTLQAIAYDFNNNTNIKCRGSNDDPAVNYSETALLLIQGLLTSVGNLTYQHINESSVLLSWIAPYTLDNIPITGYYINDSGRIFNTADLSYILSSPDPACDIITVTVSAVNDAGVGQPASTRFYYKRDFLGPVINSTIENCSNISITWENPRVDGCTVSVAPIQHYLLTIYDNITGNILVNNYRVNGTSYQYEDKDLFIHRYTYVITAFNELGEGISNNKTFSYQRVPRSATENSTFEVLNYIQNNATVKFNIPVTLECTGEAPENATITIECNETEIFTDTYLVEYARRPRNITGSVSVPQNQECILSIVFSNQAGSSEPFTLTLNTTSPITISPSPNSTSSSVIPVIIGTVFGSIGVLVAIIITIVALLVLYLKKRSKNKKVKNEEEMEDSDEETILIALEGKTKLLNMNIKIITELEKELTMHASTNNYPNSSDAL